MGNVCSSRPSKRSLRENNSLRSQAEKTDATQNSSSLTSEKKEHLKGLSDTAKQVFILCKALLKTVKNTTVEMNGQLLDFHEVCEKIRALQPEQFPGEQKAPDRETQMSNFMQWCVQKGVTMEGMKPQAYPGTGWGITACKDMGVNDVACAVPYHAMISSIDSVKEFGSIIVKSGTDAAWIQAPLGMRLYEERLKGTESAFKPYLDVLPQVFPHPIFFDATAFQYLLPSPLYSDSKGIAYEMAAQYARMYLEMCRMTAKGQWPSKYKLNADNFTLDGYLWSATIALTRTLKVKDTSGKYVTVMVPFWDLCNHGHEDLSTDVKFIADSKGPAGYSTDSILIATATREIGQGEQITLVYREDSSPADFLTVWGIPLMEYVSNVQVDLPVSGVLAKTSFTVKIYDDDFPLEDEEYQKLSKARGKSKSDNVIYNALIPAIQARLAQYPYTVAEYEQLKSKISSDQVKLAITVCVNEIGVLDRGVNRLQKLVQGSQPSESQRLSESTVGCSSERSDTERETEVDVTQSYRGEAVRAPAS